MTVMDFITIAFASAYSFPVEHSLERINQQKLLSFEKNRVKFSNILKSLPEPDAKFIEPLWKGLNSSMNSALSGGLPSDFLRNSHARGFSSVASPTSIDGREMLKALKESMPHERLQKLLLEDFVGRPMIFNINQKTSFNNIQHLHHLFCYEQETKSKVSGLGSILEWGGIWTYGSPN